MIAPADAVGTVETGSLLVAMPIAAFAGLLSFFSPCVLPLVPGYFSYVSGLSGAELAQSDETVARRGRVLLGSLLFVAGFTAVFVSYGALFGAIGDVLRDHQAAILRVLGIVTILLGLTFMGALSRLSFLSREARIHALPNAGLAGAPVLGMLFGIGWTPCIGPTLGAVLTLAYNTGTAGRGSLLAFTYCLGLGLPFVLTGLGFARAMRAFDVMKRHYQAVMRTGGAMLVVIGILMLSGVWDRLLIQMQVWMSNFTPAL